MGGTWLTYQGIPCVDGEVVLERGYLPSISTLVIAASSLLELEPPDAALPQREERVNLDSLKTRARRGKLDLRDVLAPFGTIVMAEFVDGMEQPHRRDVARRHVVSVETVRTLSWGTLWRVRVADDRLYYAQGIMKGPYARNRLRADGRLAPDSLGPDGKAVSLATLLHEQIRPRLSAVPPRLVKVPDDFAQDISMRTFRRRETALNALQAIVADTGLEEPCFRWDGTLALHEAGDGELALVKTTDGTPIGANTEQLPPHLMIDADGTGQGRRLEHGFPEKVVLVVGGERVATVAIDNLEPVLYVRGRFLRLTEDLVRQLTLGKFGIEWLKKWVLASPANQHALGVDDQALEILRMAWRLFRIRDVVLTDAITLTSGDSLVGNVLREDDKVLVVRTVNAKTGKADTVQVQKKDVKSLERDKLEVPGPNAHLLPILDRAETTAAGRMPPVVERFGFVTVSKEVGLEEDEVISAALQKKHNARDLIVAEATGKSRVSPWNLAADQPGSIESVGHDTTIGLMIGMEGFAPKYLQGGELEDARKEAASVHLSRGIDEALAASYERALLDYYAARDKRELTLKVRVYELAKKLVEIGRELPRDSSPATPAVKTRLEQMRVEARKLDDDLGELAKKRADRAKLGLRIGGTPLLGVFYKNLPRKADPEATFFSRAAGVVKTSALAGELTETLTHDAGTGKTLFKPKPVRLIFGATVRPRVDTPPGSVGPPKTVTADAPTPTRDDSSALRRFTNNADGGSGDVIPAALGDEASVFEVAFERVQRGVAREVPITEEVEQRATRIDRAHDLAELAPLDGSGNLQSIKQQARDAATALFRRPDTVSGGFVTLLRAHFANPDGLVKKCTIRMREGGRGFETLIETGSSAFRLYKSQSTVSRATPKRPRGGERLRP